MDHRRLGTSGLKVPVLSLGTATFGGATEFLRAWGETDVRGARRLVDVCLDGGLTMFDTANSYSTGRAEEILGEALAGRRDEVIISTKITTPMGDGPNEGGSSRFHLVRAFEHVLRRLRTDYVDLLFMHEFDASTAVEETLHALDDLVTAGKVRYLGASNFSGWQLMKSLAVADRYGWSRYAAHQVQYSLAVRDYENELLPLGLDQGVGAMVWSPLAGAALTGKVRRGQDLPADSRVGKPAAGGLQADRGHIERIVDVMDTVASETGRSLSQVALNWLLLRATVCSVIVGARTEAQLRDNLGALEWSLDPEHVHRLDEISARPLPYPYAHQQLLPQFLPTPWTATSHA
jgi:aryl-alcohol dehydrogenase-like predicted oxidoreductase